MAVDGVAIASGAIAGIIADQGTHHLNRLNGTEIEPADALESILFHLKNIDEALNPNEAPNHDDILSIQGYPYEYVTDAENHHRPHLSIFFAVSTAARFDIPGVGTYLKTVGPGWIQCDLPGNTRISTSDASTKGVIISYRDNALGAPL